jgi:hypothetical protein
LSKNKAEPPTPSRVELIRELVAAERKFLELTAEATRFAQRARVLRRQIRAMPADTDPEQDFQRSCASKKAYQTPADAGNAAAARVRKGGPKDMRIYQCAFCQMYHLTKTELANFAQR